MSLTHTDPVVPDIPRRSHLRLATTTAASCPGEVSGDIPGAPWILLCPEGTVFVEARERRARRSVLGALASGDPVALVDDRPLSRWRLRRTARAAGMVVERELIVLPTRNSPIAVFDDAESAVRHFWINLATVPPGLARAALPAALALHVVRALPWSWTGALAPGRVLVGRRREPAHTRRDDTGPDNASSSAADAGRLVGPESPGVLISASRDPDAKVIYLRTGADGTATPERLAMKVPTTTLAGDAVEREGRMLVELRRRQLGPLARTIPRYVESRRFHGNRVVVSTAMPGRPMSVDYHRWLHTSRPSAVSGDFALAGDWLARFQTASSTTPALITWPTEVAEMLSGRWEGHPLLEAALGRLAGPAGNLRACLAPQTAVHGDYWCGNLLVERDAVVGVVDWESGRTAGCPLQDLARFALSYSLYLDRHTRPGRRVIGHPGLLRDGVAPGVAYALLGRGWYPRLVRGFLTGGLERLGLPAAWWYDVALTGVAEVAATANDRRFGEDHLLLLAGLPTQARRYR